jgi:hypothetical protein
VVNVATPELFGVAVPRVVPPKTNVTVPMGEPVGAGVIVAVIVRVCPNVAGLGDTVMAMVVAASSTAKMSGAEEEVPSMLSPEYTVVRLNVPAGNALVLKVAVPETPTGLDPIIVVPLKKLTVPSDEPVGTGLIVAVNKTDCPNVEEAGFAVSAVVVGVVTVRLKAGEVDLRKLALPA